MSRPEFLKIEVLTRIDGVDRENKITKTHELRRRLQSVCDEPEFNGLGGLFISLAEYKSTWDE